MARKRFQVLWTQTARDDLLAIADFIGIHSEQAASEVSERLQVRASSLCAFPQRGRIVPEIEAHGIRTYRELICPPWRIIYRVDEDLVIVHAVLDGRRSAVDILAKRLLGLG